MASETSLNYSMDNAKKHYSSMFSLPSFKKIFFGVAVICIGGVSLSVFALLNSISSLVLGISLFVLTIFSDLILSKLILKNDPVFLIRRNLGISLIGWLIWFFFIVAGVSLDFAFGGHLWVKFSLLGFITVINLRFIVFTTISTSTKWRQLLSSLLQPILCIFAFLVFWDSLSSFNALQVLPFILISPIIGLFAVYLLLSSIDRLGKSNYSLPALSLFRAFVLNWVTNQNGPLERHLESIGKDEDIKVTLLKFDSPKKPKAAIIVPLVHPGPFKNIGSSLLPSLLKYALEEEFSCEVGVPLGILGHELDLASQEQNQKIVSQTIASAHFKASIDLATPCIKTTDGFATVSCQIFGDTAFLSFSLSPKTTEDLPQELGNAVSEEAKKYGLKSTIIVNAHNSISDIIDTEEHLDALLRASCKCIKKAVDLPRSHFMVGAATVFPSEFTAKDGMGEGGITAIVVKVQKITVSYIIIDGNNMILGLREKILSDLVSLGFDESEVFTTDTHAVSALVTGRRGYHPVGEVMGHEVLIRYICEVAEKAKSNMEACRAGFIQFVVPKVRVIGEEQLNSISTLVDKAIINTKRMSVPIFGFEGLILLLLLLLF